MLARLARSRICLKCIRTPMSPRCTSICSSSDSASVASAGESMRLTTQSRSSLRLCAGCAETATTAGSAGSALTCTLPPHAHVTSFIAGSSLRWTSAGMPPPSAICSCHFAKSEANGSGMQRPRWVRILAFGHSVAGADCSTVHSRECRILHLRGCSPSSILGGSSMWKFFILELFLAPNSDLGDLGLRLLASSCVGLASGGPGRRSGVRKSASAIFSTRRARGTVTEPCSPPS